MFANSNMVSVRQPIAPETCRAILDHLRARPGLAVGERAAHFDVSRVAIMNHLNILTQTDLVTNNDEPPCTVTYELREEDGGTEFDLIITEMVDGSKLRKEMLSAQNFIASNLKAMAKTGKAALTGRMVTRMAPIMALIAQKSQRIEN